MSDAGQDWAAIEAALARAQELSGPALDEYLQDLSRSQPQISAEVQSLLEAAQSAAAQSGLDGPRLVVATSVTELEAGVMLGAWRLGELIGRGGMGEVYRCERADGTFAMTAAAKVLRPEALQHLARFETERNIVARLDHPGIARLLDGGVHDSRPYMVMEYVAGVPLNDHVRGHALNLDALLALFDQVCDAVAHAHAHDVIHRDLKPGNILVSSNGRAKLLDFGIAKLLEPRSGTGTTSTQAPMTVAYSAPEQIEGRSPTAATDVHALGVILYELLTGRLPWQNIEQAAISVLMQQILNEPPPPASVVAHQSVNPLVPPGLLSGDMEAILARALQKRPDQRYATVEDFAADLGRFRRGEAITARTTGRTPQHDKAERRQISVLFCDLVGSTALSEELDPEVFRELVMSYQDAVSGVVEQYRGHIAQYLGDGVLVYFGYPRAHEDDAERAVRCGCDILQALSNLRHDPPLTARIGIHTGPVVVGHTGGHGSQQMLAMGVTTNLASRIQGIAEPGTVIISPATLKLVAGLFVTRHLGDHRVHGIEDPIAVHQVLEQSGVRSKLEATGNLSPFVGRQQELALLGDRCERAIEAEGQAVLITSEPGVGKSRLLLALHTTLAGHDLQWQEWRCGALQQGNAYAPIIDYLRRTLKLPADSEPRVRLAAVESAFDAAGFGLEEAIPLLAPLLDLPLQTPYERSHFGPELKRKKTLTLLVDWLLAHCQERPLVLTVEDLHWADPSTLETISLLVDRLTTEKLMLVLTARPEFKLGWEISQIRLQPLRNKESAALLAHLATNSDLSEEFQTSLIERAGGVPLFLEELVSHLRESGRLGGELNTADIPATLQDSLAARLDRLGEAKSLLQLCAVVGREIPYALLVRIAEVDEPTLQKQLQQLTNSRLLSRHGADAELRLVFKHALIQDSAYNALLNKQRQAMHCRIADTLVTDFVELVDADPGLVAEHYAVAQRPGLAVNYFQLAAELADQRSALEQAVALCDRALSLVGDCEDHSERVDQELDIASSALKCRAFLDGYASDTLKPYLAHCANIAGDVHNTPARGVYQILRWSHLYFRGEDTLEAAEEELQSARTQDDPTFLSYGYFHLGCALWFRGQIKEAIEYNRKAEAAYEAVTGKAMAKLIYFDVLVSMLIVRAGLLTLMGSMEEGEDCLEKAKAWAEEIDSQAITGLAWSFKTMPLLFLEASGERLLDCAENAETICERYGYQEGLDLSRIARAAGQLRLRHDAEAAAGYQTYLEQTRGRTYMFASIAHIELALACSRIGEPHKARAALERAFEIIAETGERIYDVEAHRVRGELAWHLDGDFATAEVEFRRAMEMAGQRGNRLWDLRATRSLCSLLRDRGQTTEARMLLRDKLRGFAEGLDSPELQPAQELLQSLSGSDLIGNGWRPLEAAGRWQRSKSLITLAGKLMGRRMRDLVLAPWVAQDRRAAMASGRQVEAAQAVAQTLGNMRGAAMKFGQIASFAAPGLNSDMQAALESLQAHAPAMDKALVREILEAELQSPLEAHFRRFDDQPIAAASIGQVHRAQTTDGTEVAVKIQYPGLAESIQSDLANTASMMKLARLVMPSLDPEPVVQEIRERLEEELDYGHEARCQQMFFELWDGHPSIRIPRVIPELSRSRILTMEFIHGRPLSDLAESEGPLRSRIGESIMRFAICSSARFLVFNGDPHPGNYLVDAEGRLCVLDFGCTKFWPEAIAEPWMSICHATREGMVNELNEALLETGFVKRRRGYSPQLVYDYFALLFSLYTAPGEKQVTETAVRRMLRQAARPSGQFAPMARYLNVPKDLLLMYRFQFGINAVLASLGACAPWRDICAEYYYLDPPATPLGIEERRFRQKWYADRDLDHTANYRLTLDGISKRGPQRYEQLPRASEVPGK